MSDKDKLPFLKLGDLDKQRYWREKKVSEGKKKEVESEIQEMRAKHKIKVYSIDISDDDSSNSSGLESQPEYLSDEEELYQKLQNVKTQKLSQTEELLGELDKIVEFHKTTEIEESSQHVSPTISKYVH